MNRLNEFTEKTVALPIREILQAIPYALAGRLLYLIRQLEKHMLLQVHLKTRGILSQKVK